MKIIVLGTRGFPGIQGGIEKHCEELYPRLAALGWDVTVLGRAPYTGNRPYVYRGVKIIPVACPKHKFLETLVHTFRGILMARQMGCDLLHLHAIGPALLVPFARLLGLKVILTHHGPDYERKKWKGGAKAVLRLGESWGVTGAHQVISISRTIASSLEEKFGRKAVVIPNGVVVRGRAEGDTALKTFSLESGRYVLAVGRFVPEKGFDELVESFSRLKWPGSDREAGGGIKLVLVGDADHEDDYSRSLKEKCRMISNVVLTGFQNGETLRELYTHAGLFVLPSYHEGLPIVLLEALSYGVSCLVSDIPANREVGLEDSRYFKPGNLFRMTRKMIKFLSLGSGEQRMREVRMRRVMEHYDWDLIAFRTSEVYGGLLYPERQHWAPLALEEKVPALAG